MLELINDLMMIELDTPLILSKYTTQYHSLSCQDLVPTVMHESCRTQRKLSQLEL